MGEASDLRLYRHRTRESVEHLVGFVELTYFEEPQLDNAWLTLCRSAHGLELFPVDSAPTPNVFVALVHDEVRLQTSGHVDNGSFLVVYHDQNLRWWARPPEEFFDGRFDRLTYDRHRHVYEQFNQSLGSYYD